LVGVKATRVGVVSDTHCPEFLDHLPGRIAELLAGVDLILHAGDVGSLDTLAELARIAGRLPDPYRKGSTATRATTDDVPAQPTGVMTEIGS
jgi:predicted phosphodiesterase